jgi:hypothetical protein
MQKRKEGRKVPIPRVLRDPTPSERKRTEKRSEGIKIER